MKYLTNEEEINEVWKYVTKKNNVNERSIARLKTSHSVCPVIYLLTKTHNFSNKKPSSNPDNIKVRPVISSCGGPADKVSWLIQMICNPLLQFVKFVSASSKYRAFVEQLTYIHIHTYTLKKNAVKILVNFVTARGKIR